MTEAGLYVHIPFCRSRCSYCDFATGIYRSETAEKYVQAIVREISEWENVQPQSDVDTIYFGGGTPSLLSASQVDHILRAIQNRFTVSGEAEITMEMNPGTVSLEILRAFKSLGVNRASFGAQTFDDRELASLGRSHTANETRETFCQLRTAGFENISFDLIAGLPRQTLDGWRRNIEEALSLRPEHLSFYLLEVHEGTPLADQIAAGRQPKPDDDLAASMYELMLEKSCDAGYEHYEISNLCLPNFQSRHNVKYWTGAPYYGFGCSAHSHDGNSGRWANDRDVSRYIKLVMAGDSPVTSSWQLNEEERRSERVFLGLRLMNGINTEDYRRSFGIDLLAEYADDVARFSEAGLLQVDGTSIKLTRAGALLSNEVFAAFV